MHWQRTADLNGHRLSLGLSIMKFIQLMAFREVVCIYCDNKQKSFVQISEMFDVVMWQIQLLLQVNPNCEYICTMHLCEVGNELWPN
jgi:hypothetical protein